MTLYKWSQTASSDATADPTINWAEGQAPSSVNDSARAMMAAMAKYRDDVAGALLTAGTSTAYTVSSFQVFDSLAHLNGQVIAFTPHTTNGSTVTLNVDSLGAKPLRTSPGVELQAGTIIQGTPYVAVYNNSDGAFYLQGFFGNPYNIPLGAGLEFWGSATPNSSFAFPSGQAISRTTYASLFTLIGTTYGGGDGSTTFNLPDKRGRVSACLDNMGGADAGRLSDPHCGLASVREALGGSGGEGAHALAASEIPTIASSGSNSISVSSSATFVQYNQGYGQAVAGGAGGTFQQFPTNAIVNSSGNSAISVTSNNTGGSSHNNAQPTILCNYIMRIL